MRENQRENTCHQIVMGERRTQVLIPLFLLPFTTCPSFSPVRFHSIPPNRAHLTGPHDRVCQDESKQTQVVTHTRAGPLQEHLGFHLQASVGRNPDPRSSGEAPGPTCVADTGLLTPLSPLISLFSVGPSRYRNPIFHSLHSPHPFFRQFLIL